MLHPAEESALQELAEGDADDHAVLLLVLSRMRADPVFGVNATVSNRITHIILEAVEDVRLWQEDHSDTRKSGR